MRENELRECLGNDYTKNCFFFFPIRRGLGIFVSHFPVRWLWDGLQTIEIEQGNIISYWKRLRNFWRNLQVQFHHTLREANEADVIAKWGTKICIFGPTFFFFFALFSPISFFCCAVLIRKCLPLPALYSSFPFWIIKICSYW